MELKKKRNRVLRSSKKAVKGELMELGLQKKRKRERNCVQRRSKKAVKGELMELGLQKKQKIEEEDRISQLPEDILHQILNLLPIKAAFRTCILSKSWQQVWSSFSCNLEDFDDEVERNEDCRVEDFSSCREKFREIERKLKLFINFIGKSLQSRVRNKKSIEKLRLRLTFPDQSTQHNSLNKLVTFATDRNVKELTLDLCTLSSEDDVRGNRNRVTVCHRPCHVPKLYSGVKISQLRILSLTKVFIRDDEIQRLILNCPLIERIELINCKDLRYLKLSNLLRLDCLHIFRCEDLKMTEIESPTLQTFRYEPFASLHYYDHDQKVIIDAPNLVSLEFIKNKWASCSFKTIPNLKEVELECRLVSGWFNNLKEIVGKLNNPERLNLVIRFKEGNDIVLEGLSEVMLLYLRKLRPEIILSSTKSLSLVKRLLHSRQPKTLSIVHVSSSSNLVQILNEKILNRVEVERPWCCKDSPTRWWRKLYDAKIEDLDKRKYFEHSKWIALLKSFQTMQYQTTTFRFEWGSFFVC